MQINELNWTQLNTINCLLNNSKDRFYIVEEDKIETKIEDNKRQKELTLNDKQSMNDSSSRMNFYQLNESFKKPFEDAGKSEFKRNLQFNNLDELNKMNAISNLKCMSKNVQFNSSPQINSQFNHDKINSNLNNLTFSNQNLFSTNFDQFKARTSQFNRSADFNLNAQNCQNESISNNQMNSSSFMNLIGNDQVSGEQKTKEFKNLLVSATDSELKEDNSSFYCLSNLINTTNDNQINRFVCLWQNCNKMFNVQRDLVSN